MFMVQNEKFVTCFEGVNVAEVNYFQQFHCASVKYNPDASGSR